MTFKSMSAVKDKLLNEFYSRGACNKTREFLANETRPGFICLRSLYVSSTLAKTATVLNSNR